MFALRIQLRRRSGPAGAAACWRHLQARGRRAMGGPAPYERQTNAALFANGCYAAHQPPTACSSFCHRRSLSALSNSPPSPPSSAGACVSSTSAAVTAKTSASPLPDPPQPGHGPLRRVGAQKTPRKGYQQKLRIELQDAHDLFNQIGMESRALLQRNECAATSDEVAAMTDYFLILVNSLDLEKHLSMVQALQHDMHEMRENEVESEHTTVHEDRKATEEHLKRAIKSMNCLHHIFLQMVTRNLPLSSQMTEQPFLDGAKISSIPSGQTYSAKTVGRALQLSRRAEELGLPMHRPLYQSLALGLVLTTSPTSIGSTIEGSDSTHSESNQSASLILPGQFQAAKEGLNTPPIALELLEILHHARSSLKIYSGDQLHQLAEEILASPLLLLMKSKRLDEVMGLLRGWQAFFGHEGRIDLITLLGEKHTLDALEISKSWLDGDHFVGDVQSSPHVNELTSLLEVALNEVVKDRKQREKKLATLMWQLSLHRNQDDNDFDGGSSDSDSEYELEFEYESESDDDEEELETPTPTPTTADLTTDSLASESSPFFSYKEDGGDTVTLSYTAGSTNASWQSIEAEEPEPYTIVEGLTNKEVRRTIYLRNGQDWALPDIVPQLEEWNKGKPLTFTPLFEMYLGKQIMEEDDEEGEV